MSIAFSSSSKWGPNIGDGYPRARLNFSVSPQRQRRSRRVEKLNEGTRNVVKVSLLGWTNQIMYSGVIQIAL